MSKLHEILAVESDAQGQFKKILEETSKVFKDGSHLFTGHTRTLKMFDEKDANLNTTERTEISTTVKKRLEYTNSFISRYLDVVYQKELANREAKADIIVNGVTVATDVPATFLLGLESKLKEVRVVYANIPTLPSNVKWEKDEGQGEDIFVTAYPETADKTKQMYKSQVLYEATEHHPAQIEKWQEQTPVGRYETIRWSGAVTSAEKARILGNLDSLLSAVKQARQRANSQEVPKGNISKDIIDFILKR